MVSTIGTVSHYSVCSLLPICNRLVSLDLAAMASWITGDSEILSNVIQWYSLNPLREKPSMEEKVNVLRV